MQRDNENDAILPAQDQVSEKTPQAAEAGPLQQEIIRDREANKSEQPKPDDKARLSDTALDKSNEKYVGSSSEAIRNGNFDDLKQSVTKAYENSKGDPEQFKKFAEQLGRDLKGPPDTGVKAESKDGHSLSLSKDGNAVNFKMGGDVDLKTGKVEYDAKAETSNGKNPREVVGNFANNRADTTQTDNKSDDKYNFHQAEPAQELKPALQVENDGSRGLNPIGSEAVGEKSLEPKSVKTISIQGLPSDANPSDGFQKPTGDELARARTFRKPDEGTKSDEEQKSEENPEKDAGPEKPKETEPSKEKPEGETKPENKPKPQDVMLDPKATPEDKLRAAREMAKNGQKEFAGPDGRKYQISTQNYGKREGVVVSTTDSNGKFMPVMRGIVDQNGNVSKQKDSKGREVDYTGDRAKKVIPNDAVMTHSQKDAPADQKKPEEQTKPVEPPKEQPKPEEPKDQPNPEPPKEEPKPPKEQPKTEEPPKEEPKPVEQPPKEQPKTEEPPREEPKPVEQPKEQPKTEELPKEAPPDGSDQLKKGPLGSAFQPVDTVQPEVTTIASIYVRPQATASGRPFRPDELTAAFNPAHLPKGLDLKYGDVIRVSHNGKSVDVTLTDHGPFVNGRGLDLSAAAGKVLGITEAKDNKGTGKVTFQKIGTEPDFKTTPRKRTSR